MRTTARTHCKISTTAADQRHPIVWASFIIWISTLTMVPHWMGLKMGVYLPPTTVVGLPLLFASWKGSPFLLKIDVLIIVVSILMIVQILIGEGSRSATGAIVMQWGLSYAIGRSLPNSIDARSIRKSLVAALLCVSALATVEYLLDWHPFTSMMGPNSGENAWAAIISRGGHARSEWAFGHPIALGGALCCAVPLVLSMKTASWKKTLAAAMLCLGVATTLSRGPLIGLAFTLILSVWALRDVSARVRGLLVLVLVPVGTYLILTISSVYASDSAAISASTAYRQNVFSQILSDLHPFSAATGTQLVDGVTIYRGFRSIDNSFLALAVNSGWILPSLIFVALIPVGIRIFRRKASPEEVALFGQLPVLLTVALITQYAVLVWFLGGLAVSALSRKHPVQPDSARSIHTRAPQGSVRSSS